MIFLNFEKNGEFKLGIKTSKGILDVEAAVSAAGADLPTTTEALCEAGLDSVSKYNPIIDAAADDLFIDETTVTYGSVIQKPEKVICVGLNYRRHAEESNMAIPTAPVLFSKFNNSLTGHMHDVDVTGLEQLDYEAELGLVIGKTAKNVSVDDALDYVFGYCNANDLSERALQFVSGQWFVGKSIDGFLPTGPYLMTADEAGDPQDMPIRGWLNDEARQDSHTSDMIFTVAECISYISQYMTLKPGDVIATGTPEGVILGYEEKVWMKPGDTYTVEIGNLGKLTNTLITK